MFGPLLNNGNIDILQQVQQGVMKMIRKLEHMIYKLRFKELCLFSLKKRRGGDFYSCECGQTLELVYHRGDGNTAHRDNQNLTSSCSGQPHLTFKWYHLSKLALL